MAPGVKLFLQWMVYIFSAYTYIILSSRPWKQIWSRTSWNYLKALASKIWTVQQPLRLRLLKPSRPWLEACSMENRWAHRVSDLPVSARPSHSPGSWLRFHAQGWFSWLFQADHKTKDGLAGLSSSQWENTNQTLLQLPRKILFLCSNSMLSISERKMWWNSSAVKNNEYLVLMKFNFHF